MPSKNCPHCGGSGFVVVERDGAQLARPCKCSVRERRELLRKNAFIPERYRTHCSFASFKPVGEQQELALALARKFAEDYPAFPENAVNGLLFIGPCGVGKTHLAVSILFHILNTRRLPVLFVDLNDLYREIRASYDHREGGESEYDITGPLVEAPLLLVDELGCVASPWAQDTLHYLVSQRYNEQRPTLCTTNYLDDPREGEPSLENRIGTRTRSRLYEMCRTVLMDGPDYRKRGG